MDSSFARIVASQPSVTRLSFTMGVCTKHQEAFFARGGEGGGGGGGGRGAKRSFRKVSMY